MTELLQEAHVLAMTENFKSISREIEAGKEGQMEILDLKIEQKVKKLPRRTQEQNGNKERKSLLNLQTHQWKFSRLNGRDEVFENPLTQITLTCFPFTM